MKNILGSGTSKTSACCMTLGLGSWVVRALPLVHFFPMHYMQKLYVFTLFLRCMTCNIQSCHVPGGQADIMLHVRASLEAWLGFCAKNSYRHSTPQVVVHIPCVEVTALQSRQR